MNLVTDSSSIDVAPSTPSTTREVPRPPSVLVQPRGGGRLNSPASRLEGPRRRRWVNIDTWTRRDVRIPGPFGGGGVGTSEASRMRTTDRRGARTTGESKASFQLRLGPTDTGPTHTHTRPTVTVRSEEEGIGGAATRTFPPTPFPDSYRVEHGRP